MDVSDAFALFPGLWFLWVTLNLNQVTLGFSNHLGGGLTVSDVFADLLEPVPPLRACMQMLSMHGQPLNPSAFPGRDLLLS